MFHQLKGVNHADSDILFSRTGCTEKLAIAIADEFRERGHEIEFEIIKPALFSSRFSEMAKDWPRYPSIGCTLLSRWWREHHIRTYHQVEENIQPLQFPDVSEFDRICVGGPKWAQISYPVARYLRTVSGIRERRWAPCDIRRRSIEGL